MNNEITQLIANGVDITDKIDCIKYNAQNDAVGQDISFESLYDIPIGTVLSLIIDGEIIFTGLIFTKTYGIAGILYNALDFGIYLRNETTIQFNEITADKAIIKLMSDSGVTCQCDVSIPIIINEFYIRESLENIISDILEKAISKTGKIYCRRMDGEVLKIFEKGKEVISPNILVGEPTITESLEEMKNKIVVIDNESETQLRLAEKSDENSIRNYGLFQEIQTAQTTDISNANIMANNILKEKSKVKKIIDVEVTVLSGGACIRSGKSIKISNGKLKGIYEILSAAHSISKSSHKVQLELTDIE